MKSLLEVLVKHNIQHNTDPESKYVIIRPYYGLYNLLNQPKFRKEKFAAEDGNTYYILKRKILIKYLEGIANLTKDMYKETYNAPEGVVDVKTLKAWRKKGNMITHLDKTELNITTWNEKYCK